MGKHAHQGALTEAFPWNEAPRYLIRDRDAISDHLRRRMETLPKLMIEEEARRSLRASKTSKRSFRLAR
jgi:hypothetical protein